MTLYNIINLGQLRGKTDGIRWPCPLPGTVQEVSKRRGLTSQEGNPWHQFRLGNTVCWRNGGFMIWPETALFCLSYEAKHLPAGKLLDMDELPMACVRGCEQAQRKLGTLLGTVNNGKGSTNRHQHPLPTSFVLWSVHFIVSSPVITGWGRQYDFHSMMKKGGSKTAGRSGTHNLNSGTLADWFPRCTLSILPTTLPPAWATCLGHLPRLEPLTHRSKRWTGSSTLRN